MESWDKLPLDVMDEFAEMEKSRPDVYRPIYSLHKWWAPRPGTTFRTLGLACLTDESVGKNDILRKTASGSKYDGEYFRYHADEFDGQRILDPFSGGGVTHVELNRLGATTSGYEINPVAWWCSKKSVEEVDLNSFEQDFKSVLSEVRKSTERYFKTEDPDTGKNVDILYTLLTQKVECLTCDEDVEIYPRHVLYKSKKTIPGAIHCSNPECDDPVTTIDEKVGPDGDKEYRDIKDQEVCPNCGNEFDPMEGNYSGRGNAKYICSNDHKHDIKDNLQRKHRKPEFVPFAIQYLASDGEKKWKTPDESDLKKIQEAQEQLESENLPIPEQKIKSGDKRDALRNYNYEQFNELFTPRQLLTYGRLFKQALDVDDSDSREFILTTLSTSLEYNSKLCKWHYGDGKAYNVFERNAFIPKVQPVEGNPLNHENNTVALENFFKKVYNAKEYCEAPFEKVREDSGVKKYPINGEKVTESRLEDVRCQTAERMVEDDESIDYIITDPPYYDNIQYSELSEFFYVWLREGLKQEYESFEPEYVPNAREIVSNTHEGKDEEFFIEALSNVFSECYRVLKKEGEMVFTYHHNENEAWSVVLEALIESGFTMTGAYPVLSELPNNPQIADLDNTEYDILIFCNKDEAEEEITLSELRNDLYFEIQEMLEQERERHEELSAADLGVILRGKCMYYYSKHHPEVYSEGEQVTVEQALNAVDEVIEQIIEGVVDLPPSVDQLSRSYARLVEQNELSYDDLRKQLMAKGLNVTDLEEEKLVRGPRKQKQPVQSEDRVEYIEEKLDGHGPEGNGEALLAIDKVQYLAHLYRTEQNTIEYLKVWKSDDLEQLADFLAEATGDEVYKNVLDMNILQY